MKKMNSVSTIQYLTGFIMGVVIGFGLTAIPLVLYSLFCLWRGCSLVVFSWWYTIPLPLLLGIYMAKFIANLKLEDY